jgi:hypothetical protein
MPDANATQHVGELARRTLFYNLRLPHLRQHRFYGLSADALYCRKKAMCCLVQGDRLNHADSLRFRVLRDGDDNNKAMRSCLPAVAEADVGDFSFSLMFRQVSGLSPEQPLAPTYDFFKVSLRSADRSSGTSADCLIHVRLST